MSLNDNQANTPVASKLAPHRLQAFYSAGEVATLLWRWWELLACREGSCRRFAGLLKSVSDYIILFSFLCRDKLAAILYTWCTSYIPTPGAKGDMYQWYVTGTHHRLKFFICLFCRTTKIEAFVSHCWRKQQTQKYTGKKTCYISRVLRSRLPHHILKKTEWDHTVLLSELLLKRALNQQTVCIYSGVYWYIYYI